MSSIKIVKSTKYTGGYYINGRFVLAENWHISKHFFSLPEQQQFEHYLKTV